MSLKQQIECSSPPKRWQDRWQRSTWMKRSQRSSLKTSRKCQRCPEVKEEIVEEVPEVEEVVPEEAEQTTRTTSRLSRPSPGDQDIPQIHPKVVVIVITDMVRTRGTVCHPSLALGSTRWLLSHEGQASLDNTTHLDNIKIFKMTNCSQA